MIYIICGTIGATNNTLFEVKPQAVENIWSTLAIFETIR